MDWKAYTTDEGVKVKAARVDAPGDIDFALGIQASVGQYVVEEEKETDGVKVFSHYVVDAPDPTWAAMSVGVGGQLPPAELGKSPDVIIGDLGQRTEAELIDLAALHGIEGEAGKPLKTSLVEQLAAKLEADGYEGGPAIARVRSDLAGIEGLDVPPNSTNTDPDPRSEDMLRKGDAFANAPRDETGALVVEDAGTVTETETATDGRPPQSATKDEWLAYRKSQGYTEESMAEYTKEDLIGLGE